MTLWTTPYALLREEMIQRRDEGVEVPPALRACVDALDPVDDAWNDSIIWGLYDDLAALPGDAGNGIRLR